MLALVALHLLAPPGPITWSYAHLDRHALLPVAAVVSALLFPAAGAWLWGGAWVAAPVAPWGARWPVVALALGTSLVVTLGLAWPVTPICIDAVLFANAVADGITTNPRWYLTLWVFSRVADLLRGLVPPLAVAQALNGVAAAGAMAALAATARTLARTNGEALVMTALTWTAFGVCQLAWGYLDVYPTALALTALYLWAGSAVLVRGRHPLWAAATVALAPFFYVGLSLLAPSLVVVLWAAWRRRGGRCVAEAVAGAVLLAGLATLPGYGLPFAWTSFARELSPALAPGAPVDGRGMLLPPSELQRAGHWLGLAHLFLLIDGVGCVLLAVCGPLAVRRGLGPVALWALAVLVPTLAYTVTMDPLFGVFADWDLFSWVAAVTALWGAYAFVVWARGMSPRVVGALAGLAAAAASVHLAARLNGLHVDFHRHLVETPFRVPVAGAPAPAGTETARDPG